MSLASLERGFPTCERNDVALSQRAHGVSAHIVEAKAAMNADVRVVIKVAPGYHTAEIPTGRGIPEGPACIGVDCGEGASCTDLAGTLS